MPHQLGEHCATTDLCQKPRTVCTHGMGFLASVHPRGMVLPTVTPRVYTRDALSGDALTSTGRADGPRGKPTPMTAPFNLARLLPFLDFRWLTSWRWNGIVGDWASCSR